MSYGLYTWTLSTLQENKLLASDIDFRWKAARKSRKEKIRNMKIIKIINLKHDFIKVIEEMRLRWRTFEE